MISATRIRQLAETFLGWGSECARLVLLGPEESACDEDVCAHLAERLHYHSRNKARFADLRDYHSSDGRTLWTSPLPFPQSTWTKLCAFLLGYEGHEHAQLRDLIPQYQLAELGSTSSTHAICELAPVPRPRLNTSLSCLPLERMAYEEMIEARMATIVEMARGRDLVAYVPRVRFSRLWCLLAGDSSLDSAPQMRMWAHVAGGGRVLRMPHPTASVLPNTAEDWYQQGHDFAAHPEPRVG